jgi:hypothetical protein
MGRLTLIPEPFLCIYPFRHRQLGTSILQPSASNLGQMVEGNLQLKTSLTEHPSGYSDSRIQGIMNYIDFTIRAHVWQDRQFKVEVTSTLSRVR